ncbi:MAG: universal stress protein [Dehalococcoidia bacterium]
MTVLVPLDGSQTAEAALPYAEAIVRAARCRLVLMSVVDLESRRSLIVPPEAGEQVEAIQRERLTAYLHGVVNAMDGRGIIAQSMLRGGEPAAEIIAAEAELGVAMVVMATHGRGGLRRFLIGSVADKVMRTGACPTLLVQPNEQAGAPKIVRLRNFLVPLDGSPLAEQALEPATELARATGARLTLVRVEPWLSVLTAPYGYVPDVTRLDEEAGAAAERYLDDVAQRLPDVVRGAKVVLRGVPSRDLLAYAQGGGADLVIMTTHGRGGLGRLVMGSMADTMVRSGVPTLLIRPAEPVKGDTAGGAVDTEKLVNHSA